MRVTPRFNTHTALAKGLRELFAQLERSLDLHVTLNAFLAGGMAVHLYTANRITCDVDAEFDQRFFMPNDLSLDVSLEDGSSTVLYFDVGYNPGNLLMHENYRLDAKALNLGLQHIRVHVLSPVDLALSKLGYLTPLDQEDIVQLVQQGLTSADEIEKRATSALARYVGGAAMVEQNLRQVLPLLRSFDIS
jgi:hypothetical protein